MNLIKLQISFEDIFIEFAHKSDRHTIILFNRGVMDGAAYTDENVWQGILDEMGCSNI
jgi:hypothetical protein